MALIDPRKALEKQSIREFGGVQSQATLSSKGASDIRNLRLLPDGSLEKRCGFAEWLQLSGTVRGTWEGALDGSTYFFAVADDSVYCIKPGQSTASPIYVLTTTQGPVSFVFFRERLYLLDGASLLYFRLSTGTFQIAEGYVPLYGYNWHPTEMGDVTEELNAIQSRIRIHYLNTSGSTEFRLPFTMKSLNRVKINGSFITNYTFTPYTATFQIPQGLAGGTVEILATLDEIFSRRSLVLRSSSGSVYKDPYHETLFIYGGSPGYLVYRSARVTDDMLAASTAFYGGSDPLYIPNNTAYSVGSVQHPVTAICQNGEQMLVFNDQSLWAIRHTDDQSDDTLICLLHAGIGCCALRGAIPCGENTVVVQETGITRLSFRIANPDICTAELISADISEQLSLEQLRNTVLLWRKSANELWIRSTADTQGLVWIYSAGQESWVCYDGIQAVCLFEHQGEVGFGSASGAVYLTDEALDTDSGQPFEAWYQSNYLCFSLPEFSKRAIRATLCADTGGGKLCLRLESERASHTFELEGKGVETPELFDRRLTTGRFRLLRFRISSAGSARIRVYFLSLAAS